MPAPTCQSCKVPMIPGFVAQRGHAGKVYQVRWCEGLPQKSRLGGDVKRKQWEAGQSVTAHRCPKCGLLQSYALPQP